MKNQNLINWNVSNPKNLIEKLNFFLPAQIIDSAHLKFAHEFQQLMLTDGGDDTLAHITNPDLFILLMISFITDHDIELYDNSTNEEELFLQTYIRIRDYILNTKP